MKYAIIFMSFLVALSFAACGKSGGNAPADVPSPGIAPMGPGVNPMQCQVGQVFTPQYGCLSRHTCAYGTGWAPTINQCVPGIVISEQQIYGTAYQGRFFGNMQISNANQFQLLMKYANLCDPYWTGWNFGTWNCSNWTSKGGFIELRTFPAPPGSGLTAAANMFIGAGTMYNAYNASNWMTQYYLSQYSQYIGFSQQAKITDNNNGAGMYIIGVSAGQDVGLRLVVQQGRMTDNSFSAQVLFQNVPFATITLTRY